MGGKMNKALFASLSVLACTTSTPALAQFSPSDLREMEAQIGPAKDSVPQLVAPTPPSLVDLNSANGICEAAQQSLSSGTPLTLSLTSLSSLLDSAGKQLLRDAKDQFETIAQYEARQVSRRNDWIRGNRFFVLPVGIASGTNVYNAETQIYTLDAAGTGVSLSSNNRYVSSGFEKILFPESISSLQSQMDLAMARRFYENRSSYHLIYVAEPKSPYGEKSGYSWENKYSLVASAVCRFVWRDDNQRVLYFAKP